MLRTYNMSRFGGPPWWLKSGLRLKIWWMFIEFNSQVPSFCGIKNPHGWLLNSNLFGVHSSFYGDLNPILGWSSSFASWNSHHLACDSYHVWPDRQNADFIQAIYGGCMIYGGYMEPNQNRNEFYASIIKYVFFQWIRLLTCIHVSVEGP